MAGRRVLLGREGEYVMYARPRVRWPRKKKKAVKAKVKNDLWTTLIEIALNGD